MKIGIAVCGNSRMSAFSKYILDWIKNTGMNIECVAVTSLAAASFVLDEKFVFDNYDSPNKIHDRLKLENKKYSGSNVATAVDIATGRFVSLGSKNLPVSGEFIGVDNISSGEWALCCLSPFGNLPPMELDKMKLCDSTIGWGCPYIPLASQGVDRVITVIFPCSNINYPYIMSSDKMIKRTSEICEYTIEIMDMGFDCWDKAQNYVDKVLEDNKKQILNKILFY